MKKKVALKKSLPQEPFHLKGIRPILIISLISFLVYLPTLWYGFSPMDERWLIFNQKEIMGHLGNLPGLFGNSLMGMYYRPVCMSSFMFDLVLGNGSAFVFHFTNILLHVLCVVLLFRFFLQLNISTNLAMISALFFAVHPINVHAIAWIPGRNDSLICLFTLLSCSQLLFYFNKKKHVNLLIHFFAFLLALFSKENAIVLPMIYFVLWLFFHKEKTFRNLFLLVMAWLIIGATWFFIRKHFVDFFPPILTANIGTSLLNFLKALILYSGKIILPIQQSVFPVLKNMSVIPFMISTIVLILIAFKVGLRNKKTAWLGLIWFYVFLLIPTWVGATNSNGDQYEHRIYTSLVGGFIFLSQLKIPIDSITARRILAILLISFSTKTIVRCSVYTDEFSFAEAATIESPSVAFFHDMLGYMYCQKNDFESGIESFTKAIELNSHKIEFYNNRGSAYFELKNYKMALEDDNKVLELKKDQPETYVNRSMVNYYLGNHKAALVDLKAAQKLGASNISQKFTDDLYAAFQNDTISLCNEKLRTDSLNAEIYNLRGIARLRLNQACEAFDDFDRAVRLKPKSGAYLYNRSLALENCESKQGTKSH